VVAGEQGAGHRGGGDHEVLKDEGDGKEEEHNGGAEGGEAFEARLFVLRLFGRFAHCRSSL
jgi:hypothetical protein